MEKVNSTKEGVHHNDGHKEGVLYKDFLENGMPRRAASKVMGILLTGTVADTFLGNPLIKSIIGRNKNGLSHEEEVVVTEIQEHLDDRDLQNDLHEYQGIQDEIEKTEEVSSLKKLNEEKEKLRKRIDTHINFIGAGIFSSGVWNLMNEKSIEIWQQAALVTLLSLKYVVADEKGKHHLEEEIISIAKAFTIISGMVTMTEGMDLDTKRVFEQLKDRDMERRDKVALMNVASSLVSPFITTVGGAGVTKEEAKEISDGNKKIMGILQSHVSNLSGYLLFGDPPIIAMIEKYGFGAALEWQIKNMWPLALASLFRATYLTNKECLKQEGYKGDLNKKAIADSWHGIRKNVDVIGTMVYKSITNTAKSVGFDIFKWGEQSEKGLQSYIGKALVEKLKDLSKLPFDGELLSNIKFDDISEEIETHLSGADLNIESQEKTNKTPASQKFAQLLKEKKYEEASSFARENGFEQGEALIEALQNFQSGNIDVETVLSAGKEGIVNKIKKSPGRFVDLERVKASAGHNLADIVNVFPFQAASVPFLVPLFQEFIVDPLQEKFESGAEYIVAFILMLKSMVADNYVACKIGLELFPDCPHLIFPASIQGGSMSAIGNMANIALFELEEYNLKDSIKNFPVHLDMVAITAAYAGLSDYLLKNNVPFMSDWIKAPKSKKIDHHNKSRADEFSRRDFFKKLVA